ncbi:hypothetical protein H0H92_010014 [Tricholoma furcatifolium]|nr:hypothetical protein H0H92_010014 [Tricholoma furcatifolium]
MLVRALKRMCRLKQFQWYHIPRPMIDEGTEDIWSTLQKLGTVKELEVFDGEERGIFTPSITKSNTFTSFSGLTTLNLFIIDPSTSGTEVQISPGLHEMLLSECPCLEVLVLQIDVGDDHLEEPASINDLFSNVTWPHLRVLRLRGVKCDVPQLTRFLVAHSGLQEIALAQSMPGRTWRQLDLPANALPNLRHLDCSSAQAIALLKHSESSPLRLERLCGIEVHDTIMESSYFHPMDFDEDDEDMHDDAYDVKLSPWKALFLETLKAQQSITCLEVNSIDNPMEMEVLSKVAPHVKEIKVEHALHVDALSTITRSDFEIGDAEWHRLYSLFPSLEVIWSHDVRYFNFHYPLSLESTRKTNLKIQSLAQSCPHLRVIRSGGKAVIIRDGADSGTDVGVKWVVRESWESEHPGVMHAGEEVYGP